MGIEGGLSGFLVLLGNTGGGKSLAMPLNELNYLNDQGDSSEKVGRKGTNPSRCVFLLASSSRKWDGPVIT